MFTANYLYDARMNSNHFTAYSNYKNKESLIVEKYAQYHQLVNYQQYAALREIHERLCMMEIW